MPAFVSTPSVIMRTDMEVSPLFTFTFVFVILSSIPSISEEQAANDRTIKIAKMIFFAFIGMNVFLLLKFYPYVYNANVRQARIADDRQILHSSGVFFKALILI